MFSVLLCLPRKKNLTSIGIQEVLVASKRHGNHISGEVWNDQQNTSPAPFGEIEACHAPCKASRAATRSSGQAAIRQMNHTMMSQTSKISIKEQATPNAENQAHCVPEPLAESETSEASSRCSAFSFPVGRQASMESQTCCFEGLFPCSPTTQIE